MKSQEFLPEASIFDERTLKNTAWESPTQIMLWLEANGFEVVGRGMFARAFGKPNHNRIVKLSTKQDDCWITFAQYAMTKTNNKHLPKIPWIKRYQGIFRGDPTEFFVTIIERLAPLDDKAIARITDPGVLFGLLHYADLEYETMDSIEQAIKTKSNPDDDEEFEVLNIYRDDILRYKNHPFINTIKQINSLPGNCVSDLHSGNLMVRKDGTVVITDPIADSNW